MTANLRRAGQLSWALVGVAAVIAVVGVLAWWVRVIWPPLILAGAIVFLLNPVVSAMQRRGVPRAAGAGIAYLGVLAIFTVAGFAVWPVAADQVDELSEEWPAIRERIERWIDDRAADSEGTVFEFTRDELEGAFSGEGDTFADQLSQLRDVGLQVFHVLLILVLGPIVGFYLLVDAPHLRQVAESLIPSRSKREVLHVAHRLNRAIGGFFRGQLLVATIVGLLISIGLGAIDLRFWFLVGMIAGLFNLIPLIGPWVGGIPGVVIALTTGSLLQAVGVVAIMVGVQQLDNHLITPYVMQRTVQLHPAAVVLALLAGGTLFGFLGLVLAVPTAAVLKIIIGHVWRVHVLDEPFEDVVADEEAVEARGAEEGQVADVAGRPESQGGSAAVAGADVGGPGEPAEPPEPAQRR